MARAVTDAAGGQADIGIVALVGPQAPAWDTDIPWCRELANLPERPELLIDFSLPEGTAAAAEWCPAQGVPLLSGVTGLPEAVRDGLARAAGRVPVLWSANMSLGVNLLADLAARAAAVLDADTPVRIEDVHHRWKKDAPSGTALMLGRAIDAARAGGPAIDYDSRREGEVVGDHTVTFALAGEEISLTHRARDRSIFAQGALRAGRWLVDQPPGSYSASDWLASR